MATKQAEYPYGLIAGGMGDGTVNVWDPAKLVASHPQPQVLNHAVCVEFTLFFSGQKGLVAVLSVVLTKKKKLFD